MTGPTASGPPSTPRGSRDTEPAVGAAPAPCWNCRQPLQAGAARCIWCGVPQGTDAAPLLVAPGAPPTGAEGRVASATGVASAGTRIPGPGAPVFAPVAPVAVAPVLSAGLGPAFRGELAGAGARVAAFSLDIALLVLTTAAVLVPTRSVALAAAALASGLLLLWIAEARLGATPGQALFRLRVARADAPFSPGAGPALLRGLAHGLGFLVLVAGAWVVAASSAFDRAGRGWAERLSRTVVVAVPPRSPVPATAGATVVRTSARPFGGSALTAPPAAPAGPMQSLAEPRLAEPRLVALDPPRVAVEDSAGASFDADPASAVAASLAPREQRAASAMLLVFDTGQQESVPIPAAVALGRTPVATEDGDRLVVIRDPDSSVSKTHARIEHVDGTTWVTDGGSTNGTEVIADDGSVTVLAAGVRTRLDDGARVRLGRRVLTVALVEGEPS